MVDSKVNEAIKEKCRCFKTYDNLKKLKLYEKEYKMCEVSYKAVKKLTKQNIWHAKKKAGLPKLILVALTEIHHMAK